MSTALPVPVLLPVRRADRAPTVDAAVRRRRWLRLAGTLAGTTARGLRLPLTGARGRRRLLVCGAARALTALGVRVRVTAPPVAWPRTGPGHVVVVAPRLGWLAGLALLTAVPGLPLATHEVSGWPLVGRLARTSGVVVLDVGGRATLPRAAGDPAAPICPVEVRSPVGTTAAGRLCWRGLADVVAARDVVVGVWLLPALDRPPSGRPAVDVRG